MKDETARGARSMEQTEREDDTVAARAAETGLTPEQIRNIDRAFRDAEAWCAIYLPSEAPRAPYGV